MSANAATPVSAAHTIAHIASSITESSPTIPKIGRIRSRARLLLRLVFVAAGLIFVGRALLQGIHDGSFHNLSAGWVAAAGLLAVAGMTYIAARWSGAATLVGASLPVRDAIPLYYQGEVGKYLPGAVWAV